MRRLRAKLLWLIAAGAALQAAHAGDGGAPQVTVSRAWVRGTVEGQTGSGAYMRLTSSADARLVGASSPAAERVEIHEMRRVGDRMTMRAVQSLPLPAHETVALERGYHVMLIGLRQTLHPGASVTIRLHLLDAGDRPFDVELSAPVRALGATAGRD